MLLALLTTGLRAQTESCFQEDIKPMVKTLWGQYAPYNMLCPANENDGNITHDLAGCGPVAMAQTINFHRYPGMSSDGNNAFSNCQGLRTLHFPKSLKRAGKTITNGCSSLTSVTIGAGNTTFTVRGNELQPIKPQSMIPRRR